MRRVCTPNQFVAVVCATLDFVCVLIGVVVAVYDSLYVFLFLYYFIVFYIIIL